MNQKFYTFLLLFGLLSTMSFAQITITDADLTSTTNTTWTADNEYLLDGYVFLEEGGVLNIEPGTVIKGKEIPSSTDVASALIITRGATINAVGTAEEPIIFTSEADDLSIPDDLLCSDRGLWGGLVILGRASITDNTTQVKIEGVATANPDDPRIFYGAPSAAEWDDEDNSGHLEYVSVRHGGSKLEDGDEINGITLGAVGSGTIIRYVEVYANDDDGIEWFGGTVDVKYAVVACCRDDSYDWDTGFKGKGQFWLSIHADDAAGNGAEMDGAKPDDASPGANPTVFNATYIGAGVGNFQSGQDNDHALLFRDNSAGMYANSIFTDYTGFGIQVEDIPAAEAAQDSYKQLQDGELVLANNLWFGFGEGNELNAGPQGLILVTEAGSDDSDASDLIQSLIDNGNAVVDPELNGISRNPDGGLDPRPSGSGPAYSTELASYPSDDFFTPVNFKGAFCDDGIWIQGWTALAESGILDQTIPTVLAEECDVVSTENLFTEQAGFVLAQNIPNPATASTTIDFVLPTSTNVSLVIFDAQGKVVSTILDNARMPEGENRVEADLTNMAPGIYFYSLFNNEVRVTRTLAVK